MFKAYKKFWLQYVDFKGKSSRSDYWWVVLCHILIMAPFVIFILGSFFSFLAQILGSTPYGDSSMIRNPVFSSPESFFGVLAILGIYNLAISIPNYAIMVRRLRDAGFHWSFIFLNIGSRILWRMPLENREVVSILGLVLNIALIVLLCTPTKDDREPVSVTSYPVIDEPAMEEAAPAVSPIVENKEMDEEK